MNKISFAISCLKPKLKLYWGVKKIGLSSPFGWKQTKEREWLGSIGQITRGLYPASKTYQVRWLLLQYIIFVTISF